MVLWALCICAFAKYIKIYFSFKSHNYNQQKTNQHHSFKLSAPCRAILGQASMADMPMPDTMMSSAEVWFLNMAETTVPERHQNHDHYHHHHRHHHHHHHHHHQQQQQPVATIIAPSIYCSVSSSAMELKYGCFCHSSLAGL